MSSEHSGVRPRSAALALLLGAVLLVFSTGVAAQVPLDSETRADECRRAARTLGEQRPTADESWALRVLPECGAIGGRAVADALRAARGDARPSDIEAVVILARVLRDASIFSAALELASDPSAGKAVRIQAIRVLYHQLEPGSIDPYESFLADNEMVYIPLADYPSAVGTPLPSNVAVLAETMAGRLKDDPTLDNDIAAAARKLFAAAQRARQRGGFAP